MRHGAESVAQLRELSEIVQVIKAEEKPLVAFSLEVEHSDHQSVREVCRGRSRIVWHDLSTQDGREAATRDYQDLREKLKHYFRLAKHRETDPLARVAVEGKNIPTVNYTWRSEPLLKLRDWFAWGEWLERVQDHAIALSFLHDSAENSALLRQYILEKPSEMFSELFHGYFPSFEDCARRYLQDDLTLLRRSNPRPHRICSVLDYLDFFKSPEVLKYLQGEIFRVFPVIRPRVVFYPMNTGPMASEPTKGVMVFWQRKR